jgi:hypothetical protein
MAGHDVQTPVRLRVTGRLGDAELARLEDALAQRFRRSLRAGAALAGAALVGDAGPPPPGGVTATAPPTRERALRLVAAVDALLHAHTADAASRASGWHELDSPATIDLKCRESRSQVRRLELALRTGEPITADRWRSAVGALGLAQCHLERLVQPDGATRVQASIRAIERAAQLMGVELPPAPLRRCAPPPAPLKRGWHQIVDEDGSLLGYLEVVDATYRRWYDRDLEYVDGTEAPLESEGLGPLDFVPLAPAAGRIAFKLTGALAATLARSFSAHALRRAAARSVLAGATMRGVAEAAPVVAGRVAEHAFVLSEVLTVDIAVAEAGAVRRVAAPRRVGPAPAAPAPPVAAASPVARGVSLGVQAEGPNLRRFHPGSHSLPRGFRAYDAYEGGTVESHLTRERVRGGWALVVNQVVSDARWISLKQVLDPKDATPENVARHVDKALRDMERDANDRAARLPSRDPEPVDENTYLRVVKQRPARVTLHITFDGPLTPALEDAARAAVRRSGRLADLPPFDLLLNGRPIPLD